MFRLNTISMAVMASLYLNTALAVPNNALPTGGQVTQGQAQIQQSMSQMQIQQQSQKAVIDWNSFNIGQQASVTFQQPNAQAATLNRVLNGSSEIAGQLNANGQIYLLNPNGVLFGPTAQVNTGSLVIATATLSDDEFLQGKGVLQHNADGRIVNQGNLTAAQGGQIVLSSRQIDNMGTIQADQGQVQLLAGQSTRVNITADGLIQTELQAGQSAGVIQNSGKISTTGGQLDLFASGKDSYIRHTGMAEAQSILQKEGKIYLVAGYEGQGTTPKTGTTLIDGRLDASAPNSGHGGFIETSAAQVKITDQAKVTTKATQGKTGTWLIDPTDFTISAGNAAQTTNAIGATTLETNLSGTNVELRTSAAGSEKGNIYVNADVAWSQNNLTLTAANSIYVNAVMDVNGTGTLALNTNTPDAALVGTDTGSGTVKMAIGENGFTGKVNFQQVGDNLLTINGQGYRVINDLGLEGSMTNADLQGIWGTNYLGHYALGKDIDATATSTWNNGTGFNPLYLKGQYFNGLGHTVDNLSINRPTDGTIGLIGTNEGGKISNIGLRNANIRGEAIVGGLVGSNVGLIENSFVSGIIGGQSSIGGIVGLNTIGNMVPIRGIINNSYSTARVEGSSYIGGLVGYNATDIYNSFATGLVEGNSNIGGLAGYNNGEIRNAYAIGQVGGDANIGGLVGENFDGEIVNTYATGPVIGLTNLGGLVGSNSGQISTITNSYWNTETTSQSNAVGLENGSTIATGLTTTQMQQAASFSNWGTNIDAQGGTGATWRIYEGHTAPLLRSFLRPVTVTIDALPNNNIVSEYNGNVQVGNFSPIYSYSDLSAQGKLFENNATISASGRNVGSYMATFSQDLYSDNQLGYDVSVVDRTANNSNTLTITPATLTLNAVADSKVYDGTTISAGIVNITGIQTGDTVTATQEFDSKNAGTRTLNVINPIINDGNNGANYKVVINNAVNQGQIDQASVSIAGITANDRVYDSTRNATLNTSNAQYTGMIAGDDLNVATASGQFKNKDIGTNKIVTITGIRLGGADASNYRLSNNTAMTTANINPENIQVSCDVLGTCPLPPSPPVSPVCEDCGTNEPLLVATVAECDSKDIEEVAKNCILKPKIVIQTEEQPRDDDGTPATPIQTKRALIIANGTYTDQHIAPLLGVYEDQKAVEQMLKAQGYTTTAVVDGNREQMITALNQLIKDSGEDDSVLIYYAGHGTVKSQSSVGYWFPIDASLVRKNGQRPETTWMSSIDVANFISGIKAKQILLVSDSCFSGSLSYETALQREPELPSNAVLKRRSVMVMTSGSEELVQDRDKYANNGLSPFANAFIAQLNKMDTEKELRGQNAYKFIYQGVTRHYKQYPTYGALPSARHNAGGEYLFLK